MLRIITPDPAQADTPPGDLAGQSPEDFEIVLGRRQIASVLFVGLVVVAICSGVAYMAGRAQGLRQEIAQQPPPKPLEPPKQESVPAQAVNLVETPREEAGPAKSPQPLEAAAQVAPVQPAPAAPVPAVSAAANAPTAPRNSIFPPVSELRASRQQRTGPAPGPASSPVVVSKMPPPAAASEPRNSGPADEIEASLFADPIPGARYIQVGSVDRGVAVILAEGLRTRGFNGFIAPGAKDGVYRVLVGPLRTNAEYQRAKEAVDRMGVSTFTRQFDK